MILVIRFEIVFFNVKFSVKFVKFKFVINVVILKLSFDNVSIIVMNNKIVCCELEISWKVLSVVELN